MNAFSPNDIEFHPTSFCDGNGRLFFAGGELYRGIPEKRAQFTRDLFAHGVVEELEAKRFIPRTELTDFTLPDFPLVLHHERIPFVSYAFEWSPAMLREAALFSLRYLRVLARNRPLWDADAGAGVASDDEVALGQQVRRRELIERGGVEQDEPCPGPARNVGRGLGAVVIHRRRGPRRTLCHAPGRIAR